MVNESLQTRVAKTYLHIRQDMERWHRKHCYAYSANIRWTCPMGNGFWVLLSVSNVPHGFDRSNVLI